MRTSPSPTAAPASTLRVARTLPSDPVFGLDAALAAGWTESALRHAVAKGRLLRPRRGCYARPQPADALLDVRAAAVAYPDALVSHGSAVLVHGLPLLGRRPRLPVLTVPPRANANLAGVHVHRARNRPEDITCVDGMLVTSVARTLIDFSRHRPTSAAVAAIDHALHRDLVSLDDLADVLCSCWTWPRIRRAQRAVRLADGRAESPLESVSRLTMHWLGLPAPEPQRTVLDPNGNVLGRLDFYWDEFGVAGEADGRAKFNRALAQFPVGDPFNEEKDRQDSMEHLNLAFARWRWEHATSRRYELRERVHRAFERGLARDRAGVPRCWTIAA